jgi:hypothetical protein
MRGDQKLSVAGRVDSQRGHQPALDVTLRTVHPAWLVCRWSGPLSLWLLRTRRSEERPLCPGRDLPEAEEDDDRSVEAEDVLVRESADVFAQGRPRDRAQLVDHEA